MIMETREQGNPMMKDVFSTPNKSAVIFEVLNPEEVFSTQPKTAEITKMTKLKKTSKSFYK